MANPLPIKTEPLLAMAKSMIDGIHDGGSAAGMTWMTEAIMQSALAKAEAAISNYAEKRASKMELVAAQSVADEQGSKFISAARSVLVLFLGSTYSEAWGPTGFPNQSTAVPESMAERQTLLRSLQLYFADHPEREVPMLGVTSERAGILFDAFTDARSMVNKAYSEIEGGKKARNAAIVELRRTMRACIDELSYLLSDDDSRWYGFGLVAPAASAAPEKVEEVELTNTGNGSVAVAWTGAPRAGRYRVLKQIIGVDAAPVPVGTAYDTRFTLPGFTMGQRVKVQITAANDVGESSPSEAVEIFVT